MPAALRAATEAIDAATALSVVARERLSTTPDVVERHPLAAHLFAHVSTEIAAGRLLLERAEQSPFAASLASAFVAELCRNLRSGLWLGAAESYAVADLLVDDAAVDATVGAPAIARWAQSQASGEHYLAIAHGFAAGLAGDDLDDDALRVVRAQFRRFADERVVPIAQRIHREDALIPMELIEAMAELGTFAVTIPEAYGGQGLGKLPMCILTEELSRASLGVGSLGTRSEIAAELILRGGTEEQRERWLPAIAAGSVLPTAVFTEPDFGSDLGHVRARARREADGSWRLDGAKTWITHGARADLMTVLARTHPTDQGPRGLSLFLAPKSRGTDALDFPDDGITGTEIPVLGYRGMKEYELAFDGFRLPAEALLGGEAGLDEGFRQLMSTFESARIQTAARAVGVARAALEAALRYARDRRQFGRPLLEHARIARKIGRMVVLVEASRQLAWHAARAKDAGRRSDLEAGMAKLFATRAAWECADAGVQIHGGQGYAEECVASRLLVDARVLSIFEGTNEIQATIIARRLLNGLG